MTSCVLWSGKVQSDGYGYFYRDGKKVYAHRAAYEEHVGPIPERYEVDHVCLVRACVEPTHLEAVPAAENKRRQHTRKTHCKQGHEFNEANTYWRKNGGRQCRRCRADGWHRAKERAA